MENNELSKKISRIEKMLRLGEDTDFQGESELALQMAYKLMNENGISMEQVTMASRDEKLGVLGDSQIGRTKQFRRWEKILLSSLAKVFDCRVLCIKSGALHDKKQSYYIAGREDNRKTVELMFDWIQKKTLKEARAVGQGSASRRNAYATGVARAVSVKAAALKADTQDSKDAWGIVPMDEVASYITEQFGKCKTSNISSSRISSRDAAAYTAGRAAGEDLSLNRQFGLKAIAHKA